MQPAGFQIEQNNLFTKIKSLTPTGNMAAFSLLRDTDIAVKTSCENTLFTITAQTLVHSLAKFIVNKQTDT